MNKWHGYIHTNGTLQVKRFFSRDDIDQSSPFVSIYLNPIEAENRGDAIEKLSKSIDKKSFKNKGKTNDSI